MSEKKISARDRRRFAIQKLHNAIAHAVSAFEKDLYGVDWKPRELGPAQAVREAYQPVVDAMADALEKKPSRLNGEKTTFDSVDEIRSVLPPEPPKVKGKRKVKRSSVMGHVTGELEHEERYPLPLEVDGDERSSGLGKSEEAILIRIVQSGSGLTPAQLSITSALRKRTVQNILTLLKAGAYIDKVGKKYAALPAGARAVKGRAPPHTRGAILRELSESARRCLVAIASKDEGITWAALAVMTPGLAKRTRQNLITELKTRELVTKAGDRLVLTEDAREELAGMLERPLKGAELRQRMRRELPEGEGLVFEILERAHPRAMTIELLANATQGTYATRTIQNIVTALKARELVRKESGAIALSGDLFE